MFVYNLYLRAPGDKLDCPCEHPFEIDEIGPELIRGRPFCHPDRQVVLVVITTSTGAQDVLFPCAGKCVRGPN